MANIFEEYVTKAGDKVQQLSEVVKGQKSLKAIEDSGRPPAPSGPSSTTERTMSSEKEKEAKRK